MLYDEMYQRILVYQFVNGRDPQQIVLSPRRYAAWRAMVSKMYRDSDVPQPSTGEPDSFCGIQVRCCELVPDIITR
ncbi:MAG TPA: hypothetical protein VN084_07640 [Methylophilaceae bacterium]|nr:hypothetical protein [Methylophilaceae bacterium]